MDPIPELIDSDMLPLPKVNGEKDGFLSDLITELDECVAEQAAQQCEVRVCFCLCLPLPC